MSFIREDDHPSIVGGVLIALILFLVYVIWG